jgi:hypothetical protein
MTPKTITRDELDRLLSSLREIQTKCLDIREVAKHDSEVIAVLAGSVEEFLIKKGERRGRPKTKNL